MIRLKRMAAAGMLFFLAAVATVTVAIRHTPSPDYVRSEALDVAFKNEDEIVRKVQNSLKRRDRRIVLTFSTEGEYMEDVSLLVGDLMTNALAMEEAPTDGDYIRYQYGGYTLSYSHKWLGAQYRYTIQIEPIYYTTPEQEDKVDRAVEEILLELDFRRRTSDYEKIRAIHDYLYRTVTYDTIHQKNENYHLDTTAYAALINGTARCQGYSVAAYRLLRAAGIDCRIITGTVINNGAAELHAWNLVELDGVYYNLDITWDKLLGTQDYFLKSNQSIPDHIRDSEFETESFRAQYPAAETDYKDGI